MRGWRALDGGRWLDPTQARQGTEATRAAVSMSGGSPQAGRRRGYDQVEAFAGVRAALEEENESLHARPRGVSAAGRRR